MFITHHSLKGNPSLQRRIFRVCSFEKTVKYSAKTSPQGKRPRELLQQHKKLILDN
jgi:hypothetical protein